MKQIKKRKDKGLAKQPSRPTAENAARRLVILKYVVVRALASPPRDILNIWLEAWDEDGRQKFTHDAEEENKGFWHCVRAEGLWRYLSPRERQYSARTIVTMTHEEQVRASWRVESVQTLMWALGLLAELPAYDKMADHDLLKTIPANDVADFIGSATLRPSAEIDRARDIAEFWHWRSRERELIELGEESPPDEKLSAIGFHSWDDVIRFTALWGADQGRIPSCIEEDFPACGKAYRDLSENEWFEVRSIAIERHFTLNWLCGYAPGNRWDETPTDT
ncbi:MAG: DUF4272 domain-containing protein [Thermodesulfobacteriota bacterium]